MAKGKGIKNSNVMYKDEFIMVARFDEFDNGEETVNLYDTKKRFICTIAEDEVSAFIKELKFCETATDVVKILKDRGLITASGISCNEMFSALYVSDASLNADYNGVLELMSMIPLKTMEKRVMENERIGTIGAMYIVKEESTTTETVA